MSGSQGPGTAADEILQDWCKSILCGLTIIRADTKRTPTVLPLGQQVTLVAILDPSVSDGGTFRWSSQSPLISPREGTGPTFAVTGQQVCNPGAIELTCSFEPGTSSAPDEDSAPPPQIVLKLMVSEYAHIDKSLYLAIAQFPAATFCRHLFGLPLRPSEWDVRNFPPSETQAPTNSDPRARWLEAIAGYIRFIKAVSTTTVSSTHVVIDGLWKQLKYDRFEARLDPSGVDPNDKLPLSYDLVPRTNPLSALSLDPEIANEEKKGLAPLGTDGPIGHLHLGFKWFQLAGLYVHAVREALRNATIEWQTEGREGRDYVDCKSGEQDVRAIKYVADAAVKLRVSLGAGDPAFDNFPFDAVTITSIYVQNIHGEHPQTYALAADVPFSDRRASVSLNLRSMLEALEATPNLNLLEGRATLSLKGFSGILELSACRTKRVLHAMLQKLILFLPGVLGSKIRFGTEFIWPSIPGIFFRRLACNSAGNAITQATEVVLLDKVGTSVIYDVLDRPELRAPAGYPALQTWHEGKATPFRHMAVVPWPYDWRRRCDVAVTRLSNDQEWSISRMIAKARDAGMPFVDDKVALAGHSTGGVIMKNALTKEAVAQHVDTAFFLNAPFRGAVKAYFAFLTGEMLPGPGIFAIPPPFMREVSPNTPIVYYLAPTQFYTNPVNAVEGVTTALRNSIQDVGADVIMPLVARAIAANAYPDDLPAWSSSLEQAAKNFHAEAEVEPLIGWSNCWVFWSQTTETKTAGPIRFERRTPTPTDRATISITYESIPGDGTVPHSSLRGYGVAQDHKLQVPGDIDHTAAPNHPFVWTTIVDKLKASIAARPL